MNSSVVNRNALIVLTTKAYEDWARSCPGSDPEADLSCMPGEGTVYLIPEQKAGPERWMAKNYKAIFRHELEAWYRDESAWPQDRSFSKFNEFFEVRFCSMVLDADGGPLETEEM